MGPKRKGPKLELKTPITVPKDPVPDTSALQEKYGLSNQTTLTINGQNYPCTTTELESIAELGRGMYVCVFVCVCVMSVESAVLSRLELKLLRVFAICLLWWVCFNKETLT